MSDTNNNINGPIGPVSQVKLDGDGINGPIGPVNQDQDPNKKPQTDSNAESES